jgi:ubiquinone/menaquinone biosynthesis C-methylase UbiE
MGKPMDYDYFAGIYSQTRVAMNWVTDPLENEIKKFSERSTVLEIGCGTGNYVIALSKRLPNYTYKGIDLSVEMLKVAKSRSDSIEFMQGNADNRFPYPDNDTEIAFLVDVIHHITDYTTFFNECFRVLKPGGLLIIVTDSDETMKKRSSVKYFPEQLEIELSRYPKVEDLHRYAKNSGMKFVGSQTVEGYLKIDDELISKLEKRFTSSLQLLSEEAHRIGMKRVKEAKSRSEKWLSNYVILKYKKLR